MPPLVTASAVIVCGHGGQVRPIPRQAKVTVQGVPVLCVPDLIGAPIIGCTQPPTPTTKPCTMVVSVFPGSWSLKVTAGGRPVYLATLSGLTDGIPPSPIVCTSPGQVTVQASG